MTKKNLSFGIVGCGKIGNRHAGHIKKIASLNAVCDIDIKRCKNILDDESLCFDSIDKLLVSKKKPDVISICSPNGLHAEHTIKALRAGCHVLCEKPMALTAYDAGEMIKESEKANKRLFIVKQNRFNPPVKVLKDAMEDGKLGKIYSVQLNCFWNRNPNYYKDDLWKGSLEMDGGTLYTQYSHFIDLIYWLFGDIESIKGFSDNFNHKESIEFEDTGVVAFKFRSGALGTIHHTINSYDCNMEGSITIFSEGGTIKIGGQYLNKVDYQNTNGFELVHEIGNDANQYGKYQGSMSNHGEVYENVVNVLMHKDEIVTNSFEGLKTVEIIERIYEAYNN
tara:strand:- start:16947 stop:17957 length:1011 start_codon:yes stop_codon:yes gene_type:complete